MAPGLVDGPLPKEVEELSLKEKGSLRALYVGGPKVFNAENEIKGTGAHPPARYPHYLPVWDNEKEK
jgi:sulfonate dioxygenase